MIPVEIFEYKQRWMRAGNHPVKIHSDLRQKALDWCKIQLFKQQWDHHKFTDVYEDTFYFEHHQDADSFQYHFKEWIING
jgi:hypothetical protein